MGINGIPGAGDELDDRAEEQEGAVEGESDGLPVGAEKTVEHLEPLLSQRESRR